MRARVKMTVTRACVDADMCAYEKQLACRNASGFNGGIAYAAGMCTVIHVFSKCARQRRMLQGGVAYRDLLKDGRAEAEEVKCS